MLLGSAMYILRVRHNQVINNNYPASNAIDNDDSTFSHTSNDANPWLQLNLGPGIKSIGSVKITNRLDSCCVTLLGQFKIQYKKKGSTSWLDCGSTYTLTTANAGGSDFLALSTATRILTQVQRIQISI